MKNKLKNLYCLLMQIKSTVFTQILGSDWTVTNRDRPLRRFTLGRVRQASSSMSECKTQLPEDHMRASQGRGAARVGNPCNRYSHLCRQGHFYRVSKTGSSALNFVLQHRKVGVPLPFLAASGRGGVKKDSLLLMLRQFNKSKKWRLKVTYLVTSCSPKMMNHG